MCEVSVAKNHTMLPAGTTTGTGTPVDLKGSTRELTLYVVGTSGIDAGAVQFETAHDPAYAGTWAALGSALTVVASSVVIVRVQGSYGAVRARVSTNVTNGTISAFLFAN